MGDGLPEIQIWGKPALEKHRHRNNSVIIANISVMILFGLRGEKAVLLPSENDSNLFYPFILIKRYFVADAHIESIPTPSCVRKIEHTREIDIEIGFPNDSEIVVIV